MLFPLSCIFAKCLLDKDYRNVIRGAIQGKNTVLHLAAEKGNHGIITFLLARGAICQIDSNGRMPSEVLPSNVTEELRCRLRIAEGVDNRVGLH